MSGGRVSTRVLRGCFALAEGFSCVKKGVDLKAEQLGDIRTIWLYFCIFSFTMQGLLRLWPRYSICAFFQHVMSSWCVPHRGGVCTVRPRSRGSCGGNGALEPQPDEDSHAGVSYDA